MAFTNIDAPVALALGSISVEQVEPRLIGTVWGECENGVAQALAAYMPGVTSIEDCRHLCERGQNQLWIAYQHDKIVGCALTEVVEQPQGYALRLFLTDYAAPWSPRLRSTIEGWAADLGAVAIVTVGPPGLDAMLGKNITTYWRVIDGTLRDVPQMAIPMPSEKVH
jgi:hypothetical protein